MGQIQLIQKVGSNCFLIETVENPCKASNEYAESLKDKKPVMYKYFGSMNPDDFYKLVGISKIQRYRLAWNLSSLCYFLLLML